MNEPTKNKTDAELKENNEMNEKDSKRKSRTELMEGLVILYFVVCLFIVAMAQQYKFMTYGQLSILFLPFLVGFIFFEIRQYKNPQAKRRPSLTRTVISCGLVSFMIVLTVLYNVGNLFN